MNRVGSEAERNRKYHLSEYQETGRSHYLAPFLAPLEVTDGQSFIDVGCGSGYINKYVAGRHRLRQNLGLELEFETMRIAQELNAGERSIAWVCASAEQLPLRSSSVDRLVCRGVIPLASVTDIVQEFGRVLAPGGRVVLLLHSWTHYLHWMSLNPLAWKRTAAGLLHFTLGLWFNLTGRQLRPRRGGRPLGQTFQTEYRMRRLLGQHGLEMTETRHGAEFLMYAAKPHRGGESRQSADATARA